MALSLPLLTLLCVGACLALISWHVVQHPRRLYVDENALLVNAAPVDIDDGRSLAESDFAALRFDRLYNHRDSNALCRVFRDLGAPYCDLVQIKSYPHVLQVIIDAPNKPQAAESVIIALVHSSSDERQERSAASLAMRLANETLHGEARRWLSKRLVLLLVRTECLSSDSVSDVKRWEEREVCSPHPRHSPALAAWLQYSTHLPYDVGLGTEAETGHSKVTEETKGRGDFPFLGVIRDAYMVDVSAATDSSRSSRSSSSSSGSKITLHSTGLNGNMPNMDMVSAPLAMFPSFLSLPDVSQQWAVGGGWGRLSGLLKSAWRALNGPDGLHSLFLQRNIDSITLRADLRDVTKATSTSTTSAREGQHGGGVTEPQLSAILLALLRTSSNLSEERHHSQFFYLVLDSRHFVGLGEWGPILLLALVPLVALFSRMATWDRPLPLPKPPVASDAAVASDTAAAVTPTPADLTKTKPVDATPAHSAAFLCALSDTCLFAAAALSKYVIWPWGEADVGMLVSVYVCYLAGVWAAGTVPASPSRSKARTKPNPFTRPATLSLYLSIQIAVTIALLACLAAQTAALMLVCSLLLTPSWMAVCACLPSRQDIELVVAADKLSPPPSSPLSSSAAIAIVVVLLLGLPASLLALSAAVPAQYSPGSLQSLPASILEMLSLAIPRCVFEWTVLGNYSGLVPLAVVHVGLAALRVLRG